MITRRAVASILPGLLLAFSGCGGSSGESQSSPPPPALSITAVSPSTMMVVGLVPTTDIEFYLFGENFTQQSLILVDGQPVPSTVFLDSTTLKADFVFDVASVIGTHQLTVKNGTQTSNARPFIAYWPQQGPFVMDAIPSYYVARDDQPSFFAMADMNGDGLADVILPGDVGNTVIMYGQPDGYSAPTDLRIASSACRSTP